MVVFVMGSQIAGVMRCADKQWQLLSWPSPNMDLDSVHSPRCNLVFSNTRISFQSLSYLRQVSIENRNRNRSHLAGRMFVIPSSLESKPSSSSPKYLSVGDEAVSEGPSDGVIQQKLGIGELKSLLDDSQRSKLVHKLGEANQHNRFLKRQLQAKEDSLVDFKRELAAMELEMQALVTLAEEIAKYGIPAGSRKIRGKYVQSHLVSRLAAVHVKLKEQTKDVDAVQCREVPLSWVGMAESVQVMGSFDGWSQGEHLSPEYTGSFSKFSTTLMLRPGRYEIKFLVDEEWHLSPELPTVGEGLTENNLLIVE